jgi:poly(3-hydroxybutyrate) depolymerase
MKRWSAIWFLVTLCFAAPALAQKTEKQTINFEGKKRVYYLFVPDKLTADQPAPLLLLLHGSGHNGLSLMEKWKDLARKERIILVGPDSLNSEIWRTPQDGPDFLHELISDLKSKYPIDARRLYLFGHSGGAGFALHMSLFESEYFAATAIHAGALRSDDASVTLAKRKIPIYIQVGTVDRLFTLSVVRETRDMLNRNGFNVQLTEIKGHDHWYYDLAPKINADAWNFLKEQRLSDEPRYIRYAFK